MYLIEMFSFCVLCLEKNSVEPNYLPNTETGTRSNDPVIINEYPAYEYFIKLFLSFSLCVCFGRFYIIYKSTMLTLMVFKVEM